ncbi:MAG: hypothetical protein GY841_23910 [FCB group bacterium]|nr:hypothetical protein [FCB group bacterium]
MYRSLILIVAVVFLCISMTLAASKEAVDEKSTTPVEVQAGKLENVKIAETDDVSTEANLNDPAAEINWFAISFGGGQSFSPSYSMGITIGQTTAGNSVSPSYILNHGFQQNFTVTDDCCDRPGDANGDESVNIGDPVYLINYIFKSGPPPFCMNEGEANGDCAVNIGDPVYIINYIFKSGPPPICGCSSR